MVGDFMDKVFSDVKSKKKGAEALSKEDLSDSTLSDETLSLNEIDLLEEAIAAATSKRRMIGVWDPEIAATMQYLRATKPRYSISKSAAKWIKEGLERDHPEIIKKVRENLKGRKL
jgi:hypothetical protein